MVIKIQTVLICKSIGKIQANRIVRKLDLKVKPILPCPNLDNYYNFRQRLPSHFKDGSLKKVKIQSDPEVFLIFGRL